MDQLKQSKSKKMNELISKIKSSLTEDCTVSQWMEEGRTIAQQGNTVRGRHKNWISIGVKKWRRPFVRDSWEQLEIELGYKTLNEENPRLNPGGKATGFLSIEGLMGGFGIWKRKMSSEMPSWDLERLERLRKLIYPVVALAHELDALILKEGK